MSRACKPRGKLILFGKAKALELSLHASAVSQACSVLNEILAHPRLRWGDSGC